MEDYTISQNQKSLPEIKESFNKIEEGLSEAKQKFLEVEKIVEPEFSEVKAIKARLEEVEKELSEAKQKFLEVEKSFSEAEAALLIAENKMKDFQNENPDLIGVLKILFSYVNNRRPEYLKQIVQKCNELSTEERNNINRFNELNNNYVRSTKLFIGEKEEVTELAELATKIARAESKLQVQITALKNKIEKETTRIQNTYQEEAGTRWEHKACYNKANKKSQGLSI
jgi:chromosome segregation ATPase